MREILEQLLHAVDVPNPERAQLLWDEYRTGADSTDPAVKNAADAAFATLLAWHGGGLYRHIWGFIRSDAAEDVLQDVLRKLHERRLSSRLANFNGSVLPWLRRVAIHESIDAHRRATRRRGRESRAARPEEERYLGHSGELQEMLAVALARLSREEREAIALHYFEGFDRQQAAQILGIHRVTLAKRLSQALSRLQKLIPVPVGILVGAVPGIPTALAAMPPELSAARLGELVRGAWASASVTEWSFAKLAAVATALLLGCGLAVGGWGLLHDTPLAARPLPPLSMPAAPESLQDRNVRLFNTQVKPQLEEALRKSALGEGGSGAVTTVRSYDTRIECDAVIRHGTGFDFVTRVKIVHDAAGGEPRFRIDFRGDGRWRGLDPRQPIILENPITGKRMPIRLPESEKALAAFASVEWHDARLVAEKDNWLAALARVAPSYTGAWYELGDEKKPVDIRFVPTDPRPLQYTFWDSGKETIWSINPIVGPDGLLRGPELDHAMGVMSPDNQRIEFPGTGRWWTRKPIGRGS